ncbi:MAG TPA: serine protease [Solirubrobacterales bacterium]|nr:serine protease [Solirubrobacterales bacterium]
MAALALGACAVVAAAPAHADGRGEGPVAGKAIIGGGKAKPAKWAFMAAVLRRGRLHCGGSVVAPTKVLTAAHCVEHFNPANLAVVVGRTKLSARSAGQTVGVARAVAHPDFERNGRHDVGVLTLAAAVTVPAIALPTVEEDAAFGGSGRLLRVAGWGARNPFGISLSNRLKRTTERVRSNKRCRRAYRQLYSGRSMICALGRKLGRFGRPAIHTTACSGDSGGPLVAETPLGPRVLGTVSYGGAFCGIAAAPTVYSRVSDSLAFIAGQLAEP